MTSIGYARVSTDHQHLSAQSDALTAAGCVRVFTDAASGVSPDRPGLAALLGHVRPGDVVVVTALDRLGRSPTGVIATIETLTEAGVLLRSLREGIDYSTPTGKMLAGIFAALAGCERELMHERARAARAAARARGQRTGRPPRSSADQVRQVRAVRAGGETVPSPMAGYAASRATIYRALRQIDPVGTAAEVTSAGSSPGPAIPRLTPLALVGAGGASTPGAAGRLQEDRAQHDHRRRLVDHGVEHQAAPAQRGAPLVGPGVVDRI